jgi:hypothetical protein
VIGVHMSFNDPLKFEATILDRLDDFIGAFKGNPPGSVIHIHHGIDYGAGIAAWFLHNIADGVSLRIKEGHDFWLFQGAQF